MSTNRKPSQDASSTDAAVSPATAAPAGDAASARPPAPLDGDILAPAAPPARIGWLEGHAPDAVEPLDPPHPDTAFHQTRHLRRDGWTPERMRLFIERMGECGVVLEACQAAGMSARAAYNLRDRDPLFAAGWEAACVKARAPLADEAYARSRNGVLERIYKDGVIVAERHKYDNRLTMAVLARLDARIDRAEERGDAHLRLAANWEDYLDALGEGRREDGMALLAPPQEAPEDARDCELHELRPDPDSRYALIRVWEEEAGIFWTDFPPPAGFEGIQRGRYGTRDYSRSLSDEEQAVLDAGKAEALADAEAERDAWFGFADHPGDGHEEEDERTPGLPHPGGDG